MLKQFAESESKEYSDSPLKSCFDTSVMLLA